MREITLIVKVEDKDDEESLYDMLETYGYEWNIDEEVSQDKRTSTKEAVTYSPTIN